MSACTRATLKRTDCREISYLRFLLNSVPTLSSSLKPDKRAKYVYDLSPSSVIVIDTICILFEVSVDAEAFFTTQKCMYRSLKFFIGIILLDCIPGIFPAGGALRDSKGIELTFFSVLGS